MSDPAMTEPSSGGHHLGVRVYYEDTDAGGVVYHANYLRFAERARTEALRDAGAPHAALVAEHGLMFMVRRVKLDYLAPARLDDRLDIVTVTSKLRGASVDLRQSVLRDGTVLAVLELQMVCVRCADGRPDRIPQRWLDVLGLQMARPA
jgi:acyl-CoA thioester hydrolase